MKQNSTANQNSKRLICCLAYILFFGSLFAPAIQAQTNVTVSGKVTDSKNTPLEGVSIIIKGTNKGVVTIK